MKEIADLIKPLGLHDKRAKMIKKFSGKNQSSQINYYEMAG